MVQKDQVATVYLNKLRVCLTQQDFKHLWQQALDLFLHSCIGSFFFFQEICLEVINTTVEEEANRFP